MTKTISMKIVKVIFTTYYLHFIKIQCSQAHISPPCRSNAS